MSPCVSPFLLFSVRTTLPPAPAFCSFVTATPAMSTVTAPSQINASTGCDPLSLDGELHSGARATMTQSMSGSSFAYNAVVAIMLGITTNRNPVSRNQHIVARLRRNLASLDSTMTTLLQLMALQLRCTGAGQLAQASVLPTWSGVPLIKAANVPARKCAGCYRGGPAKRNTAVSCISTTSYPVSWSHNLVASTSRPEQRRTRLAVTSMTEATGALARTPAYL